MADRFPYAIWPGVAGVLACNYTCSHGISPGVANLRTLPQKLTTFLNVVGGGSHGFQEIGTLTITDGVETIKLPDCRVSEVYSDGSNGTEWNFSIEDRRWRWAECGTISGWYNQLDEHAKLIPWTIRSPEELVMLCLDKMGEIRYSQLLGQTFAGFSINMPPGLNSRLGQLAWMLNPPWVGVATPTGTNPPISWVCEKPMQALQNLCDRFGRRIVYNPIRDTVSIVIPGVGGVPLPDGSIANYSPGTSKPLKPSGVGICGAPTKWQARLPLRAVGEEWDGSYRPIDFLSYRPVPVTTGGARKVVTCSITIPDNGMVFDLTINGVLFQYAASSPNALTVANNFVTQVNSSSNPAIQGVLTAGGVSSIFLGASFTLTGANNESAFSVSTSISVGASDGSNFTNAITTAPMAGTSRPGGWRYEVPGRFEGCVSTTRLTRIEAIELAKKHVWKTFQIADRWPGGLGLAIPGYGNLVRRQQVLMLPTKVEQVTPQPQDATLLDPRSSLPLTVNFYNGYSRDKPAEVYGSYSQDMAGGAKSGFWTGYNQLNTPRDSRVFVPFTVDQTRQLVNFSGYVCRFVNGDTSSRASVKVFIERNGVDESGNIALVVNGVSFSYNVTAGQDMSTVFSNLVSQINSSSLATTVQAVANGIVFFTINSLQEGSTLTVTVTSSNTNINAYVQRVSRSTTDGGTPMYVEPDLYIETGCHILNPQTNDMERYHEVRAIHGGNANTPPIYELHEDVQLHVIGQYDELEPQTIRGATLLDRDAIVRANYYLTGMLNRFFSKQSLSMVYNGIRAIGCDPQIQQVTWDINEQGGTTTVGQNMEHSTYVAPYPRRRLREFLEPLRERLINFNYNPQRTFIELGPPSGSIR